MHRRLAPLLLALSFVSILGAAPAQAGGFCQGPLTDRATNKVDMKDFCFFPNVVRIEKGETVTWKSFDIEAHTVTAPGGWGGGHKEFFNGDKASFRFDDEGVFPYVCLLHPGMVGAVVVGDGEGLKSASSGIEYLPPTAPDSNDTASSTAENAAPGASPSSATDDTGMSPLLLVTLAAGAALVLYVLVARVRRRYAAGGPDAVT